MHFSVTTKLPQWKTLFILRPPLTCHVRPLLIVLRQDWGPFVKCKSPGKQDNCLEGFQCFDWDGPKSRRCTCDPLSEDPICTSPLVCQTLSVCTMDFWPRSGEYTQHLNACVHTRRVTISHPMSLYVPCTLERGIGHHSTWTHMLTSHFCGVIIHPRDLLPYTAERSVCVGGVRTGPPMHQ